MSGAATTRLAISVMALLGGGGGGTEAKPSAIFTVLIDDLGYSDTQIGGRNPKSPTPTLGQLAKEGVVLTSHYVYKYCRSAAVPCQSHSKSLQRMFSCD